MELTPYPAYKPSGIDWIGDIPAHWRVKKLKYVVINKLQYGANASAEYDNQDYPRYIRITDFGEDGKLKDDTFKSLPVDVAKDYLLQEGDVLFARSGATVGKTFQFKSYEGDACYAGYLIKATPNVEVIASDFLYSYTKSKSYSDWRDSIFNQATIQNIGADKYAVLSLPLPPLTEQITITDFLDDQTKQLDQLIARKRRMIELLRDERAGLINDAVTKGLDLNAPRRDSGLPWLGDIPAHWQVKKLKYVLSKVVGGGTPSTTVKAFWDGEIPWVSPKDMKVELITDTQDYVTDLALENSATTLIPEGSVLIVVRSGILKHTFPVAINAVDVTLNQDMKALIPTDNLSIQFLKWLLKGMQKYILPDVTPPSERHV